MTPANTQFGFASNPFDVGWRAWRGGLRKRGTVKISPRLIEDLVEGLRVLTTGPPSQVGEDIAFLITARGPYRKLVVTLRDLDVGTVAYSKLPLVPTAKVRIEHEHQALAAIRGTDLGERSPDVLGEIETRLGSGLVLTSLRGRRGPRRLSSRHADWAGLCMADSRPMNFLDTQTWTAIEGRAQRTQNLLGSPEGHLNLMNSVREQLAAAELPIGLAHGDFTPWNIRIRRGMLTAFDWEAAIFEAPPLYDLFYHSMTLARSTPWRRARWDAAVEQICRLRWPSLVRHFDALRGAFLLCATDEFARARALSPNSTEGPVWKWLSWRLADRCP